MSVVTMADEEWIRREERERIAAHLRSTAQTISEFSKALGDQNFTHIAGQVAGALQLQAELLDVLVPVNLQLKLPL